MVRIMITMVIIINGEIIGDFQIKQLQRELQQLSQFLMNIFHQNIKIVIGIQLHHGVNKLIFGEMMLIQMRQDKDHVQTDGMYHLIQNGKKFMIHGIVVQINQLVKHQNQRISLKI